MGTKIAKLNREDYPNMPYQRFMELKKLVEEPIKRENYENMTTTEFWRFERLVEKSRSNLIKFEILTSKKFPKEVGHFNNWSCPSCYCGVAPRAKFCEHCGQALL